MTKSILLEKYPIHTLEIKKTETNFKTVDAIVNYFQEKIQEHPVASFISTFDHITHTKSINGEINPEIFDVKNVIFCFGKAIDNTKILAVRPRSIAIAELKDSFVIEFLEAPNDKFQTIMTQWTKDIVNL